jgi:hypothetical protein
MTVRAEKTKYVLRQHAEQNYNINVANNTFEKVEQFRYLGTTCTNENSINKKLRAN